MSADLLTLNPGFTMKVNNDDASVTAFGPPWGRSTQTLMIGVDGKTYFPLYSSNHGLPVKIVCVETGVIQTIDNTRFTADGGTNSFGFGIVMPANGTPYIWIICNDNSHGGNLHYSGIMYRVDSDSSITKVNSFDATSSSSTASLTDLNVYAAGVLGTDIIFLVDLDTNHQCLIGKLSINPASITPFTSLSSLSLLQNHFFDYANGNLSGKWLHEAAALVPDSSGLGYHWLLVVDQLAYNYMAANVATVPNYALFTRPGIYKWDQTTLTDITGTFNITDQSEHLDGTASLNLRDTYYGCKAFVHSGNTYVAFIRSYSLFADLNTTSVGTYAHVRIFNWDGTSAISAINTFTALFNTVSDMGGVAGTAYGPVFINCDIIGNSVKYLWASDGGSKDWYVVGNLIDITSLGYNATFSEFRDNDYVDWDTSGGADFTSFLDTSFYHSAEDSLFMQAPWVLTFLDNTDSDVVDETETGVTDEAGNAVTITPSLLLTPRWEWTDSDTNHKSGPTLDVYRLRTKTTVSDNRTRVRGKGRALQLHWESSPQKPFNLLGWSIAVDANTSY